MPDGGGAGGACAGAAIRAPPDALSRPGTRSRRPRPRPREAARQWRAPDPRGCPYLRARPFVRKSTMTGRSAAQGARCRSAHFRFRVVRASVPSANSRCAVCGHAAASSGAAPLRESRHSRRGRGRVSLRPEAEATPPPTQTIACGANRLRPAPSPRDRSASNPIARAAAATSWELRTSRGWAPRSRSRRSCRSRVPG